MILILSKVLPLLRRMYDQGMLVHVESLAFVQPVFRAALDA
jgi:hypothetical protein